MAQNSKIEWTHHTANLWHGCTKVHEGCDNCYAETLSKRWGNDVWGKDKPRKAIKSVWADLEKYQKLAADAGEVHRVFVGSMMDIFEKPMPLIDSKGEYVTAKSTNGDVPVTTDDLRQLFFDLVSRGKFPNLMFLLLTKRPSNINKYIPESWKENPPSNVMFGTSVVNQDTADKLIPQLLDVKGKKFLSMEPLLGPVDLTKVKVFPYHLIDCVGGITTSRVFFEGDNYGYAETEDFGKVDWVIVGGESGHHARPMHPDWVRSLRDQCNAAEVPFLFKQWGEYYTDYKLMGSGDPVFQMYNSYLHFTQKDWVMKGDKCISIDGTECKMGKHFMECKYPVAIMQHIGKKAAGNELDGKQHLEFPKY